MGSSLFYDSIDRCIANLVTTSSRIINRIRDSNHPILPLSRTSIAAAPTDAGGASPPPGTSITEPPDDCHASTAAASAAAIDDHADVTIENQQLYDGADAGGASSPPGTSIKEPPDDCHASTAAASAATNDDHADRVIIESQQLCDGADAGGASSPPGTSIKAPPDDCHAATAAASAAANDDYADRVIIENQQLCDGADAGGASSPPGTSIEAPPDNYNAATAAASAAANDDYAGVESPLRTGACRDPLGPEKKIRRLVHHRIAIMMMLRSTRSCFNFSNNHPQSEVIKSLVLDNKNVKLQSVAGSGKTTLSLHCVSRLHALFPDARALLLTYNSNLKTETRRKVAAMGLESAAEVHSFHSFGTHYYYEGCHTDEALDAMVDAIETKDGCLRSALFFRLVVVDEAQDINPLYWKIVVVIARLCLRPPQFLFIGDPRQSIYEYKGASPRFLAECDALLPLEISGARGWKEHTLKTTWRLTAPMVRFVNAVFLKGEDVLVAGRDAPSPSSSSSSSSSSSLTTVRPRFMSCNVFDVSPTSVVFDLLTRYRPEQIMVLSPSVKKGKGNSPLRLLEKRLLERNVPVSVNDVFEECSLNEQVLRGKLAFMTFHGSKGTERDAVVVMGGTEESYMTFFQRDRMPPPSAAAAAAVDCPNPVYVSLTRAKIELVVVHSMRSRLAAYMDAGALIETATLQGTVRTRGAHAEYVADLNGIAIPAFLEYRVTGRSQLLDMLPALNMRSSKYCGNLRDALVLRIAAAASASCDPSVSDFLCAATLHQSSASQYFYRAKQIPRFDWLDDADVETCMEVMRLAGVSGSDRISGASSSTAEALPRLEVPLRREFAPLACHVFGEADVVTDDALYELKCTGGDVQLVHVLQTALYAWMSGDDRKRIRLVYLLSGTVCDIDYDVASFERVMDVLLASTSASETD
eukprot:gene10898-17018_t